MSTIPYTLKIMDTGDYFILHMAVYNNVDYLMDLLYKNMDISLDILDANLLVNQTEYQFILETCSRLIPNEFKKLEELKEDLQNILNFHKIKESYIRFNLNLNNQTMNELVPAVKIEETCFYPGYGGSEWSTYSNDLSIFMDNEPSLTTCAYKLSYSPVLLNEETSPLVNEEEYLLFYHKEFHISILISRKQIPNTFYIPDLLKHIPEFIWVDTFKFNESTHIASMKSLFDKKYYEEVDGLKEKVKSFKHLYNLESKPSGSIQSLPEKERFKVILEHKYIIDKDPAHRMKASELYKQFTLLMGVQESTLFQRRLQGYFIESGLEKKRYTDGYYYYGIQSNPTVVTLNDLWKKYMKSKNPLPFKPGNTLKHKTDVLADLIVPIHEC